MKSEIRDQSAHAAAAMIALLPMAVLPLPFAGLWAGFFMGMIREVTEEGEVSLPAIHRALGSWLDLSFWTLGGFVAGLILGIA